MNKSCTLTKIYTLTEEYDIVLGEDYQTFCKEHSLDPEDEYSIESYAVECSFKLDPSFEDYDLVNVVIEPNED